MIELEDKVETRSGFAFGPFKLDVPRQVLWRGAERVAIGNRAFALLCAMLERPGELVAKAELFRRVWPDITVDEANLRVQIGHLRKALGEYGSNIIATTGIGYQFIGDVVVHTRPTELRTKRLRAPAGIDQPLGREQDIEATIFELQRHRLVTIVGPGGIGKTTLVLAVARTLSEAYADGVCFIDLGLISDPRQLTAVLASALKRPVNEESLQSLLLYLQPMNLLIVLDCCEHVVDASAAIVEEIQQAAPGVHFLATSREALRAQGELVVELGALEVPSSSIPITAAEAMAYSAVRLFARRATSSVADFEVSDLNAVLIVEICRRLDGIPLAIELAAALIGFLGLKAVQDGLDRRFAVLTRNRRTSLARHRTLTATMDWSYGLLQERERAALRRLSTFAGKFHLDDAVWVCGFGEIAVDEASARIMDLANKSLVAVDRRGEEPRYRLLETTRAYAKSKIELQNERDQAALRHAEVQLKFLTSFDWEAYDPDEEQELITDCLEEVRVALDWAFGASGNQEVAVKLTLASEMLWLELALTTECIERMHLALERVRRQPKPDERQKMMVLTALSSAQISAHMPAPDSSMFEEAWEIASQIGNRDYQLRALWGLIHAGLSKREGHLVLKYALQFEKLAAELPNRPEIQLSDHLLGYAYFGVGDLLQSRQYFEKFLQQYTRPTRSHAVLFGFAKHVSARMGLAAVLWMQGQPESALTLIEDGLAEAKKLHHGPTTLYALGFGTCFISLFTKNASASRRHLQALKTADRLHNKWGKLVLAYEGMLQHQEGNSIAGLDHIRSALEGASPARAATVYPRLLLLLSEILVERGELSDAARQIELAMQCATGPEDVHVVSEALRMRAELAMAIRYDGHVADAEALLLESIRIAGLQQASTLELSSSVTLANLWTRHGRSSEAMIMLDAMVCRMTEGFDLPPMINAKKLLFSGARNADQNV